jgi:REP element-mobilizing transposase RayT
MILAYHAVFTAYGFWLPNDPRGSWSNFVGSWELFRFGPATKTDDRRSLAAKPHDRALRQAAKTALKYPPVHFDGHQALAVSRGFSAAIAEHGYQVFACSILPEHVHLVVARCDRPVERIVAHLKAKATAQLNVEGRHPLSSYTDRRGTPPTPWGAKCWKCFLDDHRDIARAIRYVQQNPLKDAKRPQHWPFLAPWRQTDAP